MWLKDNSNTTSYYELPENVPEYSVMSWWGCLAEYDLQSGKGLQLCQ